MGSAGFSLTSVLIGLGIASVLMISLLELTKTTALSSRNLASHVDMSQATNSLLLALGEPVLCAKSLYAPPNPNDATAALQHPKFDPVNGVDARDRLNSVQLGLMPILRLSQNLGAVRVTAMDLVELDPSQREIGPQTRYVANLRILFEKPSDSFGLKKYVKNFPILITTDTDPNNAIPDHQIVACKITNSVREEITKTNVVIAEPSVYVQNGMNHLRDPAYCAPGYAMIAFWDDNDRFSDIDGYKCRKFDAELVPQNCTEITITNAMDGPNPRPQATDPWRVECGGNSILTGIDDDNDGYADIDGIQCCELKKQADVVQVDRSACVGISSHNRHRGPDNPIDTWLFECPTNYAMIGIWDDNDNFGDLDAIKCCRYTIPSSI